MTTSTDRRGVTLRRTTITIPVTFYDLLSEYPTSVSRGLYYCALMGLGIDPNAPTSEIEENLLKLKSKLDEFKELGDVSYPQGRVNTNPQRTQEER